MTKLTERILQAFALCKCFLFSATVLRLMVLTEITCPYCNNIVPAPTVAKERQWGIAKVFNFQNTTTIEATSYLVNCLMCNESYHYFEIQDFSWLRNRLLLSAYAIESFKTMIDQFGDPTPCDENHVMDWIFNNVVGITRDEPKHLHICFDCFGHRIFLDCYEQERFLSGINFYKVY